MPRRAKGARLWWHKGEATWIIRDGATFRRTGCGAGEAAEAERQLSRYLAEKHAAPKVPEDSQEAGWQAPDPDSEDPAIHDLIVAYAEAKAQAMPNQARFRELVSACGRIIRFAGEDRVSQIDGAWCARFAAQSTTPAMARRDLETARAAINHHARQARLAHKPVFTLPPKAQPREGHLTRAQAARLLHRARRDGNHHLARFILIGLYTGTRAGAILAMGWMPNLQGGWFDLERGIMHRAAMGERRTKKRKPPCIIPDRLAGHLRRWHRADSTAGATITHVIHWKGAPVASLKRSMRETRNRAGLPAWVSAHTLRHTAITWAMQQGMPFNTVADYFGLTLDVLERTYWHHHPNYQQAMRRFR